MTFKEYYFSKYPNLKDWGYTEEELTNVHVRVLDTFSDYVDEYLDNKMKDDPKDWSDRNYDMIRRAEKADIKVIVVKETE